MKEGVVMNILTVKNINKIYQGKDVLKNISIDIKEGEVYGLLGKNGIGKTTLLKIITRLIPISNYNRRIEVNTTNKTISALIDTPACYMNLSVKTNLQLCSYLYYKRVTERKKYIEEMILYFDLENMLHKKMSNLSLGMLQKVKLAMIFMANTECIILDEPFNGLDIESSLILKNKIKLLSKELNRTIIITSHNTEQLEKICDRFGILKRVELINVDKTQLNDMNLEEYYYKVVKDV